MPDLKESLDKKVEWANYFAEVLRIGGHTEASAWLKSIHGSTDLEEQINDKLESLAPKNG